MTTPVFRFAPSPNGYLHLGHALSALINFEMARAMGGRFLLRIEDIDATRCRPHYEEAIYEDLDWLGLRWEEPVRRQSAHLDDYRAALARLDELVYPSFETRGEIARLVAERERHAPWPRDPDGAPLYPGAARALGAAERRRRMAAGEPYALRLDVAAAVARTGPLTWTETGCGAGTRSVAATPEIWGDVVLARKETPTSYHLSVVIDDACQGVTHVVRGRDLFTATSVHRQLQALFALPAPTYHHHRLILDADGKKLSKSTRATALRALREDGASAADIRRMVGLAVAGDVSAWQCALGGMMARRRRSAGKLRAKRVARSRTAHARAVEATLADIAHEIRTPLTGILALGELLATSELGARERDWAIAIKSTAEHLALVTSLIVDAVRSEAKGLVLRRELIRPRRLADALAASLAARAEAKGLEYGADISPALPEAVIGDALRLRAALENLIDNAVKFTERGSVHLEAGFERAARGKVRLVFTVTDSGIGLTGAEIKRLFRPFVQANEHIARRYGGAGLGLSFVKRIAKAMGGDLTVKSEPGRGSRFRMRIAMDTVAEAAETATSEGAAALQAPVRALAVLCVEDNPHGRVLLNTILAELGHRADFVATGAGAVEAVARGSYDVVIMDVTLPDIDGVEATRRIRALPGRAGRVPIVGVSGRVNAEAAGRAAGMNGYLTKPLSPSALTQALGSAAQV